MAAAGICALISWHLFVRAHAITWWHPVGLYTLVVSSYVTSRFVLAAFYRPPREAGLEPRVAIVVPAFNEGEAVVRTIDSCLGLDYPADKLEVVVVNDGSTDDTWEHMQQACARHPEGAVRCIDLGSNQGKRAAMGQASGRRAPRSCCSSTPTRCLHPTRCAGSCRRSPIPGSVPRRASRTSATQPPTR